MLIGNKGGVPVTRRFQGTQTVIDVEYHDKLRVEETAWRAYRRLFHPKASTPLVYRSAGLALDYAPLLLKSVADELIRFVGLRFSARKLGQAKPAYFGKLPYPGAREKLEKGGPMISRIHRLGLWLSEIKEALTWFGVEWMRIAVAFLAPHRAARGINAIWIGAGPGDYGKYGRKRCFYWPDRVRSAFRNLYVLSYSPNAAYRKTLEEEGVQWVSQFQILRFCSKGALVVLGFRLAQAALAVVLPWHGSWVLRARACGMHFEALAWDAFGRALRPRAAFTVASSWTSTRPVLVALKHTGAKTAVWHYSANVIPVHPRGRNPYGNGRWRTVHEADRIYVWSSHGAEWHRTNLCDHPRNEIVVTGPVMCGDPVPCLHPPVANDSRLRIAVFDVTMAAGKKRAQFGRPHIPDEYFPAFWSDLKRLVNDLPESVLLLKPKRSFDDPRRAFPETFFDLARDGRLVESGRIQMIEENADPYAAIAGCDVALGMPFTSPVHAAWHFGRVGIYYDPIHVIGKEHFESLEQYFCSGYDALLRLLRTVYEAKIHGGRAAAPGQIGRFIGRSMMENPQEALIGSAANWVFGAAAPAVKPQHEEVAA